MNKLAIIELETSANNMIKVATKFLKICHIARQNLPADADSPAVLRDMKGKVLTAKMKRYSRIQPREERLK